LTADEFGSAKAIDKERGEILEMGTGADERKNVEVLVIMSYLVVSKKKVNRRKRSHSPSIIRES
jgi:hypothetical protein